MELVDQSGYQLACQRYFEFTHKTDEIITVNHPNQYFEQSYRLINGQSLSNNNNNKHQNKHNNDISSTNASLLSETQTRD